MYMYIYIYTCNSHCYIVFTYLCLAIGQEDGQWERNLGITPHSGDESKFSNKLLHFSTSLDGCEILHFCWLMIHLNIIPLVPKRFNNDWKP